MKSSLYNLNFTNQTIKLIVSFLAILFFSKKIHHACVSFYYFFKDINGTIMKFMMSFFYVGVNMVIDVGALSTFEDELVWNSM